MEKIKGWMERDAGYVALWKGGRKRMEEEMRGVGGAVKWWERDRDAVGGVGEDASVVGSKLSVVWPADAKKRREKKRGRRDIRVFVCHFLSYFLWVFWMLICRLFFFG